MPKTILGVSILLVLSRLTPTFGQAPWNDAADLEEHFGNCVQLPTPTQELANACAGQHPTLAEQPSTAPADFNIVGTWKNGKTVMVYGADGLMTTTEGDSSPTRFRYKVMPTPKQGERLLMLGPPAGEGVVFVFAMKILNQDTISLAPTTDSTQPPKTFTRVSEPAR